MNIEGWSTDRDDGESIELTSEFGDVSINLAEIRDGLEI